MNRDGITRRNALTGAATMGVAVPLLAACGGEDTTATDDPGSNGGGEVTTSAAEIPVGGGKIFADESLVITQPTEGDFKCFTAVCTHQGCLVSNVEGGTINCKCHASQFSIEDGSPQGGPATSPLAAIPLTVDGDQLTTG